MLIEYDCKLAPEGLRWMGMSPLAHAQSSAVDSQGGPCELS